MFATRGYHASSLREIAGGGGHQPLEPAAPLRAARRNCCSRCWSVATRHPSSGSSPAFAATPFDAIVAQAAANERIPGLIALYSVLSAEVVHRRPSGPRLLPRPVRLAAGGYEAEFEELREAGRLRDGVDPAMAAASVIALWEGIQLQWLYAPERIHAADALRAYLDLVIRADARAISGADGDDEGADA